MVSFPSSSFVFVSIFIVVFSYLKVLSKSNTNKKALEEILSLFHEMTDVLGILYNAKSNNNSLDVNEIESLIKEREIARQEKNWKRADEIRDELKSKNVIIEDTAKGTKYSIK